MARFTFTNNGKPFDPDPPRSVILLTTSFLDKWPDDDFLRSDELAEKLHISPHTLVTNGVSKSLEKLGYSGLYKAKRVYGSKACMNAMRKAGFIK